MRSGNRREPPPVAAATPAQAPYADLTPERMLAAIDATGYATDGRLLALNSYENRVYQVGVEPRGADPARFVVAKFYRPGRWNDAAIEEEHRFAAALAEAELPVIAPLVVRGRSLFSHEGYRYALYRRVGGRTPEWEGREMAARLGRLIARIHLVGARERFVHREALDVAHLVQRPARAALASGLVPAHVEQRYRDAIARAVLAIGERYERAAPLATLRLHGDCHPGNLLATELGPTIVDLDDARTGPAVQDLWMLMTGDEAQRAALLEGYGEFRDLDPGELQLIDALRLMRQIHHAGWLAERWHDPAFPRAFPYAGEPTWWETHVRDIAEGCERLEQD